MATVDKCCIIAPYFKVQSGKLNDFKELCEKFVERAIQEEKCLFYGFSFSDDLVHCREGYADAESLMFHLEHAGDLLSQALKISELARLEVHGPKAELDKLSEVLEALNPQYYALEYGFHR